MFEALPALHRKAFFNKRFAAVQQGAGPNSTTAGD